MTPPPPPPVDSSRRLFSISSGASIFSHVCQSFLIKINSIMQFPRGDKSVSHYSLCYISQRSKETFKTVHTGRFHSPDTHLLRMTQHMSFRPSDPLLQDLALLLKHTHTHTHTHEHTNCCGRLLSRVQVHTCSSWPALAVKNQAWPSTPSSSSVGY